MKTLSLLVALFTSTVNVPEKPKPDKKELKKKQKLKDIKQAPRVSPNNSVDK